MQVNVGECWPPLEYSISALRRGNSHEKAFSGERTLALATMVFSVFVFLIGVDRTPKTCF
jgi:hypothetical protein